MKTIHIIIISLMAFVLFSSNKCSKSKPVSENIEQPQVMPTTAREYKSFPNDPYADMWKEVQLLFDEGKYKSAHDLVVKIDERAVRDKNEPEIIRALIARFNLAKSFQEDSEYLSILEIEQRILSSSGAQKAMLHMIAGRMYWTYYTRNQYKINSRTATNDFENPDFRTWDASKFKSVSQSHFLSVLPLMDALKNYSLADFHPILNNSNDVNYLIATLYDLANIEVMSFFRVSAAQATEIDNSQALMDLFSSYEDFMVDELKGVDDEFKKLILNRYQDLLQTYHNEKDWNRVVYWDLERLKYLKGQTDALSDKSKYMDALNRIIAANLKTDEVAMTYALLATEILNMPKMPDFTGIAPPKVQAKELCETAISKFQATCLGVEKCKGIISYIENKSLSFQIERVVSPDTEAFVKLNYQNVHHVHFKLIALSNNPETTRDSDDLLKQQMHKTPIHEWKLSLKNFGDFDAHSMTSTLPKLDFGRYLLVVSESEKLEAQSILFYQDFQVSNLALTGVNSDENTRFMVLGAQTGNPMPNVTLKYYESKYNYTTRNYEYKLKSSTKSDKAGFASSGVAGSYNGYVLLINGRDSLFSNAIYFSNYRRDKEKVRNSVQIFTDRAIYRPGQEVFFKGIYFSGKDNDYKVVPNKKGTIELYDVNSQKVGSFDYVTNEFGSYSGSFRLPQGGLNGQFYLQDKGTFTAHYFNVEEYKRPKFEVKVLPLEGEYKFNEEITVKGEANAFSGQVVDGAKVTYRINESYQFPRWGWYSRGYYPSVPDKQVDFGELVTDENGVFELKFVAKPNSIYGKMPYFTQQYSITFDVVDITGETQSMTQNVSVANHAMELSLLFADVLEVSTFKYIGINATNLNGQPLNAKGTIEIVALEEPKQMRIDAGVFKADYYASDSANWSARFPNRDFYDLNNPEGFKEINTVAKLNFDTEKSTQVDLGSTKLKPGRYKIKALSKDKFGVEIFNERIITNVDKKANQAATNEQLSTTLLSTNHQPNEHIELLISSGHADLSVLLEVLDADGLVSSERFVLNKSQRLFKYKILEKQRGGVYIRLTTQKWGSQITASEFVHVPFTNKDLTLKFESFRNKLLPGQEEQWKLTIQGKLGDKVAAELVAALYDASLDQFASNDFYLHLYGKYIQRDVWMNRTHNVQNNRNVNYYHTNGIPSLGRSLPSLNYGYYSRDYYYNYDFEGEAIYGMDAIPMPASSINRQEMALEEVTIVTGESFGNRRLSKDEEAAGTGNLASEQDNLSDNRDIDTRNQNAANNPAGKNQIRTNLNETAFFFPHLQTNSRGEIVLSFTMPEALTRWKFISLAHTKDMRIGTLSDYTMTQKELMIQPNPPRFLREGDTLSFVAKVSNLSEQVMTGFAALELFDARTMEPLNVQFKLKDNKQMFALEKGANASVYWDIVVPIGVEAVIYRVSADAGNFVDGEENMLPILSNRMLVIETLPLPSKGVGTRNFRLEKLFNSGSSRSIQHHSLTLEYTSNPAWYAVQAIPYLMEYPHECAEQLFSRYYANALATHIMQANPKIKEVFEKWENETPETLLSNLEKNQELKYILLNETPWVMQAQNETERKKRISTLFNFSKMERELDATMRKLQQIQSPNGGFPWFKGMPDNPYITKHIVMGAGHLDRLGIKAIKGDKEVYAMFKKAVIYMDERFYEHYLEHIRYKRDFSKDEVIHYGDVQYLYARSFFNEIPMSDKIKPVRDLYLSQMMQYKMKFSLQGRAMIALCLHRYGFEKEAKDIVAALKDIALISDEMGMYWKDNVSGYYWHQAPIETQALMIEAFDEVAQDLASVEEMKVWLLKNKQTNDWKTTKATTMAVYTLFMRGTDLLTDDDIVDIYIGDRDIKRFNENLQTEAGTGYFKHTFNSEEIQPIYGDVRVVRKKPGVSWGALYWQYFEDLDKITPSETPLKLKKQLFVVRNSPTGEVMMPISNNAKLKPGDKIRVRIELRSDRDMEFVHMKDMRAAGFEPVNVISRYNYQGGIGYYESTKDASTDFFIDFLRKGIYVFEYDMRANLKGQFANGITTIQCMYAPEFTSHSEGVRVRVE
jgi:uncharacterized protein YfaS (alpha-2-macroglobulin family)